MKKLLAIMMCAAVAVLVAACGGSASGSASGAAASVEASASAPAESAASAASDLFDGSAFSDTGAGEMTLKTSGGTSEGGSVPQIASKQGMQMMQIELDYNGGDGSVCTVYVDGVELQKLNAGERSQNPLTLEGAALDEGVHTVEMVCMDGDEPTIYKKAQYEIVF